MESTRKDRSQDNSWWTNRWIEGRTGWDLGGPHPHSKRLIENCVALGLPPRSTVWLPGCGRAHDGAFLARLGYSVVATDIAAPAIAEARAQYGDLPNLRLVCADALTCSPEETRSFAMVFDRAMLCALRDELRPLYVAACAERLAPGGLFAGILFAKVGPTVQGPPFAISGSGLGQLFGAKFEILVDQERTDGSCDDRILAERLFIARLR